MAVVYDNLRLHITNDSFYVEVLNAGSHDVLVLDRINFDINLQSNRQDIPPSLAESKVSFWVLMCVLHLIRFVKPIMLFHPASHL